MTLEHKHIAGLELALEQWSKGWPSANYAGELRDLIAQAKAAPAQGESVEVVALLRDCAAFLPQRLLARIDAKLAELRKGEA
jgi:hypothetical protein